MEFQLKYPNVDLGWLPMILSDGDTRSASEQINDRYSHGGGWRPLNGFTMLPDGSLQYLSQGVPDDEQDPPLRMLAEGKLREETIRFYEHSWLAVIQPDGAMSVSRMD